MSGKAPTKFPAVAVGQRFVWRGSYFVKTSPLLACAEDDGRSQMIPRSAVVELADTASPSAPPVTRSLRQALEDLQQTALEQVDALIADATPATAARARKAIEATYRRVLQLFDDRGE